MKVETFLETYQQKFGFELIAGRHGVKTQILSPFVESPGLSLAGYLKGSKRKRILIFSLQEVGYLLTLPSKLRLKRLNALLHSHISLIIFSCSLCPLEEMIHLCELRSIPLVRSRYRGGDLMSELTLDLEEHLIPNTSYHGCFVEVFNVGMLLEGDSAVGKSEAALGLIERGHRFIADDILKIKRLNKNSLEGSCLPISRHYMEVRGIGLIDIAHLYGTISVREKKSLDIVVKLELWDDGHFYDRAGLDEKTISILDVEIPHHILPIKPGRDVVLLLEVIALNYRQKKLGNYSARELDQKLLTTIEHKRKRRSWMKKT